MKRALLLALLLAPCAAGCKHATSSSSTEHTEATSTTETKTEESGSQTTTTVVTEAPGTVTTTISEYAPPSPEPESAETPDGGIRPPPKLSRHGPLVRRTVTVESRGGETTQTKQEAVTQGAAATETKAAGKSDVQAKATDKGGPSAGCIGASWLWGLAALAFAVLLILGAIRLRKAVP